MTGTHLRMLPCRPRTGISYHGCERYQVETIWPWNEWNIFLTTVPNQNMRKWHDLERKQRNAHHVSKRYYAEMTWPCSERPRNPHRGPERKHTEILLPWSVSVYRVKGPSVSREKSLRSTPFLSRSVFFSLLPPLFFCLITPFLHYRTALQLQSATALSGKRSLSFDVGTSLSCLLNGNICCRLLCPPHQLFKFSLSSCLHGHTRERMLPELICP